MRSASPVLSRLRAPLAALLLLGNAAGGARTVLAAGNTVIVAATDAPTDCGRHRSAVTDLAAALTAAHSGKILLCPGTYALPGGTVVSGAKGLTIGQAVKGVAPRVLIDPSATVGLEIRDSRGVTLDGLVLDATANEQTLVMVQLSHARGKVRRSTLIGSATTATSILADAIGGTTPLTLAVSASELRGYQSFGVTVAGPMKLEVSDSLFDGSDGGRIATSLSVGVTFDGTTDDPITPTGFVRTSTFLGDDIGIRVLDGSRVTIGANRFSGNHEAVEIWGGIAHALSRNNRIVRNAIDHCDTCVFIDDEAADPARFQLLNTVIADNVFRADSPDDTAVDFRPLAPAVESVTGTVSGNTFIGFLNASHVLFDNNDYAGVKLGKNTIR
jgi:parallel beta helix pectate lyase-like protein